MIKSLQLNNFQSHKDALLEFHPGVNVIVGSSRSGKTATLRALNWVKNNKPAGKAFNSYWNRDKKKDYVDFSSATMVVDDKVVCRKRNSTFNGYTIDEEEFSAVNQDVPEDVLNLLNLSEVNIQKQFDTPYLLGESSAEVARLLNKTIKLDKIDEVLSKAESRRRTFNKDLKHKDEELKDLEIAIENLTWVDEIEIALQNAEAVEKRIENKKEKHILLEHLLFSIKETEEDLTGLSTDFNYILEQLSSAEKLDDFIFHKKNTFVTLDELIDKIVECEAQIEACPEGLNDTLKIMSAAEKFDNKIEKKIDEEFKLAQLYNSAVDLNKIIKNMPDNISEVSETLFSIEKNKKDLEEKFKVSSSLNTILKNILKIGDEISGYSREIKRFESQMPEVCPTCGQPFRSNSCGS